MPDATIVAGGMSAHTDPAALIVGRPGPAVVPNDGDILYEPH